MTDLLYDVAKAYRQWEADLIENGVWPDFPADFVFAVTQDQYDRMIEIQAMRDKALAEYLEKPNE